MIKPLLSALLAAPVEFLTRLLIELSGDLVPSVYDAFFLLRRADLLHKSSQQLTLLFNPVTTVAARITAKHLLGLKFEDVRAFCSKSLLGCDPLVVTLK